MTADKDEAVKDADASIPSWKEVKQDNEIGENALDLINARAIGQSSAPEAVKQKLHDQASLLCESGEMSVDQLNSLHQTFQLAIAQILSSIDARIAKVVERSRS